MNKYVIKSLINNIRSLYFASQVRKSAVFGFASDTKTRMMVLEDRIAVFHTPLGLGLCRVNDCVACKKCIKFYAKWI